MKRVAEARRDRRCDGRRAEQVLVASSVDEPAEGSLPQRVRRDLDGEAFRNPSEIEFHAWPGQPDRVRCFVDEDVAIVDRRSHDGEFRGTAGTGRASLSRCDTPTLSVFASAANRRRS